VSPPAQTITEDLRRWIVAQAEAGCRLEDVLAAMRRSGWDEATAAQALELTLPGRGAEASAAGLPLQLPRGAEVPEPLPAGTATVLQAAGHTVQVLTTLRHPRVVVFGSLLSDDECDALVALARPRLARSETVDHHSGGSAVNPARTSEGMFFERTETPLIARIEERIAALLHWPATHGEGLQILRYGPGAEYKPHHDFFDPQHPGTASILQRGGQRVGTLVMYLNTPESGGATVFPDVTLEVAPVKGGAVFFSYDRPHAVTRTLHGGAPVLAGEKWVATKWLRQGVFT
jgi:prolyl 4-hydroxylase